MSNSSLKRGQGIFKSFKQLNLFLVEAETNPTYVKSSQNYLDLIYLYWNKVTLILCVILVD